MKRAIRDDASLTAENEFSIKLAGIPIRVHALFRSTKEFCRYYLTEEPPLFEVTITMERIKKIRMDAIVCDLQGGRKPQNYTDNYLETLVLLEFVADEFLSRNILLFHGSAVAVDRKAYLFTAKSGVGKTTHTKLWLNNIPGTHVLNGDKPFLLFHEDDVYACGSPWRGKEGFGRNEMLPLAGICLLERDNSNHIESISYQEALSVLLFQSHKPAQDARMVTYLKLLSRLSSVPLYRLGCNMENEAAWVSYKGMAER